MIDLHERSFYFPPIYAINTELFDNPIQQIIRLGYMAQIYVETSQDDSDFKTLLTPKDETQKILAIADTTIVPDDIDKVLFVKSITPFPDRGEKWARHPLLGNIHPEDRTYYEEQGELATNSWKDNFYFRSKATDGDAGLRLPQLGALFAALAHRTVSQQTATIVMPTGTGKTDTMISIFVAAQCKRVLVIVPTDALRSQISEKFLTLGVLKKEKIISDDALFPIIGILIHKPKEISEVDDFFRRCNVIVTTMAIAGQCSSEVQKQMALWCTDLFIDEAHHIGAPTWNSFRKNFENHQIIQFTATPFRNDSRAVGGKIIYNYPLSKAQHDGFFRPIKFDPIIEYNPKKADLLIAAKAVKQLKKT